MKTLDLEALINKLNPSSKQVLEAAAAVAVSYEHYEITPEHFVLELLRRQSGDFQLLMKHYEQDIAALNRSLMALMEKFPAGNSRRPVFSPMLIDLLQESWMFASLEWSQTQIRTGAVFFGLVCQPHRYLDSSLHLFFKHSSPDSVKKHLEYILTDSNENVTVQDSGSGTARGTTSTSSPDESALAQFATNFTQLAREGRIDPVYGREREIRQMIDILARRRKNNPIVVGEAGVGKTAVVEGLARKIIEKDVPDVLRDVELWSLDLGLLQAGASMKGQFEQRLKSVIAEINASIVPIILFIDEAHTLIGAGGAAGGGDAANLLKPALARGELRTVAATTWSEYKKYFEKDPALARRFQLVKVDEPETETALLIMRGLKQSYEQAHQVYVTDAAINATVELAARYLSGRQLPDKSVDLLDTACARVRIAANSTPPVLDDIARQQASLRRELEAISRDQDTQQHNYGQRIDEIKFSLSDLERKHENLMNSWQSQRQLAQDILLLQEQLQQDEHANEKRHQLLSEVAARRDALREQQKTHRLLSVEVSEETVASVVADWTGIPLGDMLNDEAATMLQLEDSMGLHIKGQDHALGLISSRVRAAKAGLGNADAPLGVFLLVGPSGVGKTETAISLARLLFGGEQFLTSINMSEFQEKHSVSRLIGSPPGYVGYGEGGVLTEAVRQKPYSVVLLDEVEKADLEVMNLFYQVFDKGVLSDGEGRLIDFRNTIIMLTSNLATQTLAELAGQENPADMEEVIATIRPELSRHFKPALLARMEVVPYYPLLSSALGDIVKLKLDKLAARILHSQKIQLSYEPRIVQTITQRCTEVETGARNIDHIINKHVLPEISTKILSAISLEQNNKSLHLGLDEYNEYRLELC